MTGDEQCDDGNHVSGDGCSSLCTLEEGYVQVGKSPLPVNLCGDGLVVVGETCDDRNLIPGDGCTPNCTVELGYKCAACGDANTALLAPKVGAPDTCHEICGDGVRLAGQLACDDGGNVAGDGCSPSCAWELGWACCSSGCSDRQAVGRSVCTGICGDGYKVSGEACDDGNTRGADGCSSFCAIEPGYSCEDGNCRSCCYLS
ncbi:hypothetical protein T484DRAFT_1631721 [Baffinella frigidus]|nr:hypothetical protein T484DRAFT_1631721 [Cryptophyta sp. CCMP2293]